MDQMKNLRRGNFMVTLRELLGSWCIAGELVLYCASAASGAAATRFAQASSTSSWQFRDEITLNLVSRARPTTAIVALLINPTNPAPAGICA